MRMIEPPKVLVLGVTGMLGHRVYMELKHQGFGVKGTVRMGYEEFKRDYEKYEIFDADDMFFNVSIDKDVSMLRSIISNPTYVDKYDYVINCIGLTKPHSKDVADTIYINALLPHLLAGVCKETDSTLIHVSTDCVFSGNKGNYLVTDQTDAKDLYGRTKALGEVYHENALTIRTSIIGRELGTNDCLLEWILSQPKDAILQGFTEHIWTGITTIKLAEVIARIIDDMKNLRGLIQIASDKINKYDLLNLIGKMYQLSLNVEKKKTEPCDRSMISSHLIDISNLESMLRDFFEQNYIYEK